MQRAALSAVITVPGNAATAAFGQQLNAQTPEGKVVLLGALAARGDGKGLTELVNKLATGEDATVREAAISALGKIGDGSSVPLLVAALKDNTNSANAMRALSGLRAEGVAESLIKQVESGEVSQRATLLGVLADRKQMRHCPSRANLLATTTQKCATPP